jgi:hypothetical protein
VHRRLGVAAGVLAVLMVGAGLAAAIDAARRAVTPEARRVALTFLAIPFGDMVVFAMLVGAGLCLRRRSETHKRLMLLATIALLPAAFSRLPYVGAAGPAGFYGATDLLVIACLPYDRITRGRVHPAFLGGGLLLILSQPVRLALSETTAWHAFAAWLIR